MYFSFVLHITQTFFNEQDDKDSRNIITPLSASNSVVYEWYRTWGTNTSDIALHVALDSSDNIYLAGLTDSYGEGSFDIALVKFSSFGELQWNITWGGIYGDKGYGVAVDLSDNIYLTGGTDSSGVGDLDMVLVKYDVNGVCQCNHTWGGNNSDKASGIAVDSSDNTYLAGFTHSFGEGATDMALVKFGKAEGKEKQIIHGFSILFFISAIGVITAFNLKKKLK